ncbi:hypothetical protein HV425_08655 [Enterococcus faecium]|nr:hypothetical protein [Enterococcus faecium]NVF25674.1 hypothetical protein [Enterococcus faecium]
MSLLYDFRFSTMPNDRGAGLKRGNGIVETMSPTVMDRNVPNRSIGA